MRVRWNCTSNAAHNCNLFWLRLPIRRLEHDGRIGVLVGKWQTKELGGLLPQMPSLRTIYGRKPDASYPLARTIHG